MKKDWLRIITPCIIAIVFLAVVIVSSLITFDSSGGWSMLGIIICLPILIFPLLIEAATKFFISSTFRLWIMQLVIVALTLLVAWLLFFR